MRPFANERFDTQLSVGFAKIRGQAALLLVHEEPTLSGKGRYEEKRERPGRNVTVGKRENSDTGP